MNRSISTVAAATAMGLSALPAQALTTLSYGALVEPASAAPIYLAQLSSTGPFTSGGPLVAQSGGAFASVDVTADPVVPVFKSATSTRVVLGSAPVIAESYARMDLKDTLRFAGPGATASVDMTLYWDTQVSGLSVAGLLDYDRFHSFLQSWSFQRLEVSYLVPDPAYDPGCVDDGEVVCPGPDKLSTSVLYNSVGTELRLVNGQAQWVAMDGESAFGNGLFTGARTLSVVVPTGQDVFVDLVAYNGSRCFNVLGCDLSTDASRSDYLGFALPAGYSLTSSAGYGYSGPSPVPEPSVWAISLLGLMLLGLQRKALARGPAQD